MKMLHQYHTLTTSVNSISLGSKSVDSMDSAQCKLQANESYIKIFLQTTIYLYAALSDGIENPEVLVSNVNVLM